MSKEEPAPTVVGFDVRIPLSQPNPGWYGTVELFIDAPSIGVNNQPLGVHQLNAWTPGQWRRAEFSIPTAIRTALGNNYQDLRWRIQLNVPPNSLGQYLFDRFTWSSIGGCVPTDDGNPCTIDQCNASGQPEPVPAPAGTACSDANVCNGSEVCNATGTCQPGTPLPVDDGNPCTTDACNPVAGVTHTPVPAGTSCANANLCDGAEACNATGVCNAGTPVICTALDQCHDAGTCAPTTGVCSNPSKPNGTSCTDGSACTQADACQAGTCTGSNPVVCVALDQCHDAGTCDPGTGVCSNPAKPNGTSCSDGSACTQADACQADTCTGSNPVVCVALDQCHDAGTCNPGTGSCSNPPKPNGAACSDGNGCTQADTCQTGTCTAGAPTICAALDQCHLAGTCDPASGACSNPTKPDGAACSDTDACTQTDSCQAGTCTGANPVVCVASDSCHAAGTCNPTSGTCTDPALPDGTPCNDATVCNGNETCATGTCTAGTPPIIDDANPCTADACDPATGVTNTPVAAGTSCANATVCDGAELCDSNGTCTAGTSPVIDDGNPCTIDTCDPGQGVVHTPVETGTSCSDFDLCNGSELCDAAGACQPGTPVVIDTTNPCSTGSCDPGTGTVTYLPSPEGTECFVDACTLGACSGQGECAVSGPTIEDDGDPCTVAWCDPVLGRQEKSCSTLDRTVGTAPPESMNWIYTGSNPVQVGVAPGTIVTARAAVLRGSVNARGGGPLPSVRVSVRHHPEFGYTTTRTDGYFDMVVNGGGTLTLEFSKDGYLDVVRTVRSVWRQEAVVEDVTMIQPDSVVTTVNLESPAETIQVARGSSQSDERGSRQGTLLVPSGTEATMAFDDGSTESLAAMNVRITEFTVGADGPAAMPAPLPRETAYTYAFEVNADEAVESQASTTTFSAPLVYYVENFLGFPVGTPVPFGSFDREQGVWKAEPSGLVIAVLGESGGLAQLDVDGDDGPDSGSALTALGITSAELAKVAELYEPGQSLWRTLITHFTLPCDFNWPPFFEPDEIEPDGDEPETDELTECPSSQPGASTIDCETQVLREKIPVAGTPFALHYSSARVPGRMAAYEIRVQPSRAVPQSLLGSRVWFEVAGRRFLKEIPPGQANVETSFVWDGLDAFGRRLQGRQKARVTVEFAYRRCYGLSPGWTETSSGTPVCFDGQRAYRSKSWQVGVGPFDAQALGFGGWTLSAHHSYGLVDQQLELGTGGTVDAQGLSPALELSYSNPGTLHGIDIGPDGTAYHSSSDEIWRRPPGGGMGVRIAGSQPGYAGDGGPAGDPGVRFFNPFQVRVALDDSLYIWDYGNSVIRKIRPDGIIERFAGSPGIPGHTGDGGPALDATLRDVADIAPGKDGSLYIAISALGATRVRRVDTNGRIATVVGGGDLDCFLPPSDGVIATDACLDWMSVDALAIGPDGILYTAIEDRVARLENGRLYFVAGCVTNCAPVTEGANALDVAINPEALAVDSTGILYLMDNIGLDAGVLRQISPNGKIASIAGGGPTRTVPTVPALGARISPWHLALGPDDKPNVASLSGPFFRLTLPLPAPTGTQFVIGDRSGDRVHFFDAFGHLLNTRHSLTGETLLQFAYGASGLLTTVTDESGNATQVERSSSYEPLAVIGPYGHRTELELDENGYLSSVTDPDGNRTEMTYSPKGLLTSVTNARGQTSTMTYDTSGRLTLDRDSIGGEHALVSLDHRVERTTALGRTTVYDTQRVADRNEVRIVAAPSGVETVRTQTADQATALVMGDGTVITNQDFPDARFRWNSPNPSRLIKTPSGLTRSEVVETSYTNLNPNDIFSFDTRFADRTVNGRTWTRSFDRADRTYVGTSPAGRQTTQVIDAVGRVTNQEVTGILPIEFSYDARGRLERTTQGNRVTTMAYVPEPGPQAGYLGSVTDALLAPTSYTRDALGRIVTETRAGATTTFSWDALSNLEAVVPPGKPSHGMAYSPVNLLESYAPPPAGLPASSTSYTYDLDRMLRTETRPTGDVIVRTPDNAGRLDTVVIAGGLLDYDYYPPGTPSGAGKISDIRGPYGTDLSYTYDGFLTTSTSWNGDVTGSIAWQYNNDFNRILETVAGQSGTSSAVFGYDNDQLLTCASPVSCAGTSSSNALRLTRSPQHGMITRLALGSTNETWTYNAFGELARQTATFAPSTPLVDITYDEPGFERDKLGRIVRKTEVIGGVTKVYEYAYDAFRRLTDVTVNGTLAEHFEYDANGNRTLGYSAATGLSHVGVYDDQDRLLSYGPWEFTYTANGELESKLNTSTDEEWLYQYDVLGNLLSVGLPNGDLVEYLVDGMGRRVGKKKNGVLLKQWIYRDALKPVAELDGAGNLVSQFVYGTKGNVPDFVVRNGVTYRVISDHLGSPRQVVNVNNSADVPFSASYTSFGAGSGSGLDWMPFAFAGGIYDSDTGLVRFGARDLDFVVGRWTAKEPMLFAGRRMNFYTYVNNDPVNRRDPTGLTDYGIGTDDCSYYGERCEENEGRYYCEMAPEWCEKFPSDPPGEIDDNWALCTRQCLQDCDASVNRSPGHPNASTGTCHGLEQPDDSTPFTSSNNFLCHVGCYTVCGAFALGSMGSLY